MRRAAIVACAALALASGCKRRKPEAFTTIWLGPNKACGRIKSGDVICWGGGDAARPVPERRDVTDLALGETRSCAIRGEAVACEGPAVKADPKVSATKVVVGGGHACAVLTSGVRCWGKNDEGQAAGWSAPVRAIAAGEAHTCVAVEGDAVHCFGRGFADGRKLLPGVGVRGLAAGKAQTCALLDDGSARCWTAQGEPARVEGLAGAAEIAAGYAHVCARLGNGSVSCWGENAQYQLADGTNEKRTRATAVHGLFGVEQIVAAADGTCARLGDGEVKCWGNDDHGQLAWPALPPGPINVPTPIRYMRPAP